MPSQLVIALLFAGPLLLTIVAVLLVRAWRKPRSHLLGARPAPQRHLTVGQKLDIILKGIATMSTATDQIAKLKTDLDAITVKMGTLTSTNAALVAEGAAKDQQIADLTASNAAKDAQIAQLQAQPTLTQADQDALAADVAEADALANPPAPPPAPAT